MSYDWANETAASPSQRNNQININAYSCGRCVDTSRASRIVDRLPSAHDHRFAHYGDARNYLLVASTIRLESWFVHQGGQYYRILIGIYICTASRLLFTPYHCAVDPSFLTANIRYCWSGDICSFGLMVSLTIFRWQTQFAHLGCVACTVGTRTEWNNSAVH